MTPVSSLAIARAFKALDRDIELAVRRTFIIPRCLDEPLEPLAQIHADGYARHRLAYPPLHKPIPFPARLVTSPGAPASPGGPCGGAAA